MSLKQSADTVAREIVEKWKADQDAGIANLPSFISDTLGRYAEALDVAKGAISRVLTSPQRTLDEIDSILSPAPEMEDVPIDRWAIIAPSGYGETTYLSEERANAEVEDEAGPFAGYSVVKLTGTIQRPKVKPVVKSASEELQESIELAIGYIENGELSHALVKLRAAVAKVNGN